MFNQSEQKTKSPLKGKPLRYPGQSLDERINKLINENALSYIAIAIFAICYAGLEWYRWYFKMPYSPIIWTLSAILISSFSAYKAFDIKKKIRLLRLGRDGERVVGQFLELMREKGYKIFHDIIDSNYNIDHVIICKHGVFTVETKTFSKPAKGKSEIKYDGKKILINGRDTSKDILGQARAEAKWLKEFLMESTGKKIEVKPIITFPGWYIDSSKAGFNPEVWVLNPKAIDEFIQKSGVELQEEEISPLSFTLNRYIRQTA